MEALPGGLRLLPPRVFAWRLPPVILVDKDKCKQEPFQGKAIHRKVTSGKKKPDQKKCAKICTVCPLCTEKMDATDLLLEPCSCCEFKLCLFCYNDINEEGTGVCPGCRKKYEQQTSSNREVVVTFQHHGLAPVPLSSSFQGPDDDSA
ncbi:hypothetical protein N665_1114s0004 [Sinapis alba]|nr:hypothetical protein N665_1114s0004 [Sinapis alba]